jgi:glycosyltransferase involved in cell wall biosynthesis
MGVKMNRKGIYFDGNLEFVNTPIFNTVVNSFTYEFWVKPEQQHEIFSESSFGIKGNKNQRYVIGPGHGESTFRAGIGVSVGTNGISVFEHTHNHLPAVLVYQFPINDWIHVAIVYNNRIPSLFVNGEFKKRGLTSNKTVHASGRLGGLLNYGFFVGCLDEIRIWNYPRSQPQIKNDMIKTLSSNTTGLVFYQNSNTISQVSVQVKDAQEKNSQPFRFTDPNENPELKIKKVVVVIDRFVPHFDRDAGSRSTFHIIQLFVKMGLKVIFFGHDFLRHEPYTSQLQQLGIEVLYGTWIKNQINEWITNNSHFIDYFFINRPDIALHYIDTIKNNTTAKVIYYGLDLQYLRLSREYQLNPTQKLLNDVHYYHEIEKKILEKVDVAYYPSIEEIRILDQEFPNVKKRAIPMFIFTQFSKHLNPDFSQRNNLIFVAGFDHRPNIDAVLWFCSEIFPIVYNQIPDIKIFLVGSNPNEKILALKNNRIIVTGTVSDFELVDFYRRSKIAVVPLRYGAGVKGKVIEAMYNGVPVVTTPIGAEGLFSDADIPITITNDPIDMANKIITLYNQNDLLNDLSTRSIKYIERHFSMEKAREIISQDF